MRTGPSRIESVDVQLSHRCQLGVICVVLAMSALRRTQYVCKCCVANAARGAWVKLRRTQCEHMFSALPSGTDFQARLEIDNRPRSAQRE
jgi:hypothetical protein